MKRAILIAGGKVQKVRYRSKGRDITNKLGVLGEAEDLGDGSVRIATEAEKAVLVGFMTFSPKNQLHRFQNGARLVRLTQFQAEFFWPKAFYIAHLMINKIREK